MWQQKILSGKQTRTNITRFVMVLIMGKIWVQCYVVLDPLKWWHMSNFKFGATRDLTQAKSPVSIHMEQKLWCVNLLVKDKGCRLAALKQTKLARKTKKFDIACNFHSLTVHKGSTYLHFFFFFFFCWVIVYAGLVPLNWRSVG